MIDTGLEYTPFLEFLEVKIFKGRKNYEKG